MNTRPKPVLDQNSKDVQRRTVIAPKPTQDLIQQCLLGTPPIPARVLQPCQVFSFNRLLSGTTRTDYVTHSTVRNLLKSSWTVYTHVAAVVRPRTLCCESLPTIEEGSDRANQTKAYISKLLESSSSDQEVLNFINSELPWDRIKRTYFADARTFGQTPQLSRLRTGFKLMVVSLFTLFFYQSAFQAQSEFKKQYATSVFATQSAAQKRRYQYIIQTGFRNAVKNTLKGCSFLLPVLFMQQGLEVYWNKTTPLSFTAAFGLVGGLAKVNLGLKGIVSSTVIGSVLGGAAGMSWLAAANLAGQTQEKENYDSVKKMLIIQKNLGLGRERDYREDVDDMD